MKTTLYNFYTEQDALNTWEFIGPKKTGLLNKSGSWNWSRKTTPTKKTGPIKPKQKGYVYCESSTTKVNDVFYMISKDTFDFSFEGGVSFWYNANVTSIKLEVEIWDGYMWVTELELIPESSKEWIFYDINLNKYENLTSKVKFKITMLNDKPFKNDFAIDFIEIDSVDFNNDDIDTYMENKELIKLKKGRKNRYKKSFNTKKTINITDIVQQIETDIENSILVVEDDIIIHETDSISYLIKA